MRRAVPADHDQGAFSAKELGALCRLFDALGDGLILVDQLGVIRRCNEEIHTLAGYTASELTGESIDILVPESVRQGHRQLRRAFIEGGTSRPMGLSIDLHLRRKDGREVPVDISLSPVRTAAHGPWVAAVVRDVTDRRQLEIDRRRAESRHRSLIEQLPAAVFLAEPISGSIVYMSPQIEGIVGFPPQDWIDDDLMVGALHEADRERVEMARGSAREAGKPFSMEYRMSAADGRTVWIREASTEIRDESASTSYRQGILLDVSSERAAQTGLLASFEALQLAEEQRRELLDRLKTVREDEDARIAADIHDDVLQRILVIALRMGTFALELPELGQRLEVSTLKAELLSLVARLRTLVFEVYPPELREGRLGDALGRRLPRIARDSGLTLEQSMAIPEQLPEDVGNICYRVIQEAVMNVVRHARATTLAVFVGEGENGIVGRVEDDGVGFDEQPWTDSPLHLGLASMRDRVESAGGRFQIVTSPGRGTTVEFWVPLEVL